MTADNQQPAADRAPGLLVVRDLRAHFPIRRGPFQRVVGVCRAVDGVSFDIPRGTTLGLVGESGCGKTTLGRTILRLASGSTAYAGGAIVSGQVLLDGVDVLTAPQARMPALRRAMQMVFQDPSGSLSPRMTVGQIVGEPLAIHRVAKGRRRRDRVVKLLEHVGLGSRYLSSYAHELSGGQRQRVAIARALALEPRLIVCDEPVSALDVSVQAQVLNLLTDLQDRFGLTYLFIGHNLAVVGHVSQRVAVMYLGRIVELAEAGDAYSNPLHPYTGALLAAVPPTEPTVRQADPPDAPGQVPVPQREPADSGDTPPACAYYPRCPSATAECRRVTPVLTPVLGVPSEHLVACHNPAKISPLRPGPVDLKV